MSKAKMLDSKSILNLRAKVLRPGMQPAEAVFKGDDDDTTFHLGVVDDRGEIIAISSYYKNVREMTKQRLNTSFEVWPLIQICRPPELAV